MSPGANPVLIDANPVTPSSIERGMAPPKQPIQDDGNSFDSGSTHTASTACQAQLPFEQVGLVGRNKQIRLLRNAFNKTCARWEDRVSEQKELAKRRYDRNDSRSLESASLSLDTHDSHLTPTTPTTLPPNRTLVLIAGHSGSGKTALAMQIKHFASTQTSRKQDRAAPKPFHGFFVSGKCEISKMNAEEPYAGIKSALMHLCDQILCLPHGEDGTVTTSADTLKTDQGSSVPLEINATRSHKPKSNGNERGSQTRLAGSLPAQSPGDEQASFDDPRRLSTIRRLLMEGLTQGEIQVLSAVIPELDLVAYGTDLEAVRHLNTADDSSIESGSTRTSDKHQLTRRLNGRIGYRAHGDRLKFALQRLIQIICNYCPLIFVIDDLQWADKASLDIFKSWMLDSRNTSLMIIGCYRSNLLEENNALKTTLTSLDESKRERSLRILKLPVEDLEVHHINELLCCLLCPQDARQSHGNDRDCDDNSDAAADKRCKAVHVFSDVVYKKTGGNPFFVQRFLHSLVHEGLLKYNGSTQSRSQPSTLSPTSTPTTEQLWDWTWNDDDIQAKSPATSNIIELMKEKLRQVQEANQILPIAACLGASFSYSTICIVMRGLSIHSAHSAFVRKLFGIDRFISTSAIRKMLQICTRQGLLEKSGGLGVISNTSADPMLNQSNLKKAKAKYSAIYNFSHDKVQEAALDMVDQQQLSELKYRVGEILLFGLSEDELEERIFMVTNLINARPDLIPDTIKSDRGRRVMMLNFDAGTKAASCSAFHLALEYFRQSIDLLPRNHWQIMKAETLQIYSAAAESAYVTSKLDRAREYCDVIISSDCDVLEKIDAYNTLTDVAMAEIEKDNKESSAVRLCVDVLSQLGCKLPKPGIKRNLGTKFGLLKLKRDVHKLTNQTIDGLPLVTDRRDIAVMRMLGNLMEVCFFSEPDFLPSVALEIKRRTFKYGVSQDASSALVFLGMMMGYDMGDFEAREIAGQLAFRLLDRVESPTNEASVICESCVLIQHWQRPVEEVKEPLMEAYRLGMSTGMVQTASWSIMLYIRVCFYTGVSLAQIDEDCSTYSKVMLDFHQNAQYKFFTSLWQMILNLRGASKYRIQLIGDAFDERSDLSGSDNAISGIHNRGINMFKTKLCLFFGEYEQGAKMSASAVTQATKDYSNSLSLAPTLFRTAFNCFAASHTAKDKKRKYCKTAKRCLKQLKEWNKQGHPNCPHYIMILDGERAYLNGNYSGAIKMYKKAIESAGKRGYVQDQAMASERLGDCCMDCGRRKDAKRGYKDSIRFYDAWGAARKVADLQAKADRLFV